jgi:hypothetical protein
MQQLCNGARLTRHAPRFRRCPGVFSSLGTSQPRRLGEPLVVVDDRLSPSSQQGDRQIRTPELEECGSLFL